MGRHGAAMTWDETCSWCENTGRWWPSRSGYRVCQVCCPTPDIALEVLARRGAPGWVQRVQGWWHEPPYRVKK
jgi:hypothetical protein